MRYYTLKELCIECGVSRRAVQGYQKNNLVKHASKTNRGYLLFDEKAVNNVRKVKSLQNYGFSIKEIVNYYSSDLDVQHKMLRLKLEELKKQREKVEQYIFEINALLNNDFIN